MRGLRAFGSPPPMSSRHSNLEPLGGSTRQYIIRHCWNSKIITVLKMGTFVFWDLQMSPMLLAL